MTSEEGLNAYGAVTWGQFFIYQGFNARVGWMHTSSGVDAVDEYLETVDEEGRPLLLQVRKRRAADASRATITVPYKTQRHGRKEIHHLPHASRSSHPRTANGKWVASG